MFLAVRDFEVASIPDWTEHCAHQGFDEAGGVAVGARFDFLAKYERAAEEGKAQAFYGCAKSSGLEVCVPGLSAGRAAFVEVNLVSGKKAIANPLVFLSEEISPPAFVASELFAAECVVFLSHHGNTTGVITHQRALSFDSGKIAGWVIIKDAQVSLQGGPLVVSGEDARGWKTALRFDCLFSPPSLERLINGLRAKAIREVEIAREKPDEAISAFFGAPIDEETYGFVRGNPGCTATDVAYATGLNRYVCRSSLRRLYLDGKIALEKGRYRIQEQEGGAASGRPVSETAFYSSQGFKSAGPVQDSKTLDDLAEFVNSINEAQQELAQKVERLSQKMDRAGLSDLQLHMARLDAEIATVVNRLNSLDTESQANFSALKKEAKWAREAHARLSWANTVVTDKAQRTMKEYAPAQQKTRAARPSGGKTRRTRKITGKRLSFFGYVKKTKPKK